MPSEQLDLNQYPEGILSVGEKTFKISNLLNAAQEDLVKKSELNRLFISTLRVNGILSSDDLINIASSFFAPKSHEKSLEEAKWFEDGLDCQLLIPGTKNWQQGRVRIKLTVEFDPSSESKPQNESQSPLDDLRRDG